MQSHDDTSAADALDRLRKRAEDLTARGENLIAAGAPFERTLSEVTRGGFLIRQLPEDPLALRISIGEAHEHSPLRREFSSYLVYRGDRDVIVNLLRRALAALA